MKVDVEIQGEELNKIEGNMNDVQNNIIRAELEIDEAEKEDSNYNKRGMLVKFGILFFVIILIVTLLLFLI